MLADHAAPKRAASSRRRRRHPSALASSPMQWALQDRLNPYTILKNLSILDIRDARALHTLVLVDIYRYAKLAVMNGASESLLHGAYSSPHTGRRQAFTAVQTCEPLAPFSLFSLPPPLSLSPAISGRQFLAACHDLAQSGPACTTVAVCNTESVDRWRPCLLPGKAQLKRAPLAAAQRR